MENYTCNSPKQWIPSTYHSQPEEKSNSQKTKTPNHNNTTTQKLGNIHISQSTNTENN